MILFLLIGTRIIFLKSSLLGAPDFELILFHLRRCVRACVRIGRYTRMRRRRRVVRCVRACARACTRSYVQGYVSVCVGIGMYVRGVAGGGNWGEGGGRRGGETTSHSQTVLQILSKTLIPLRLSLTTSSSTAVKNPICAQARMRRSAAGLIKRDLEKTKKEKDKIKK
jgi:hypothetical protein